MNDREAELTYEAGKDAVVKTLVEMGAKLKTLEEQVRILTEKIAALSKNSRNSSRPPSTDGPGVVKPKRKKSSKNPGGQKGHKGHKRELLPVEEMDHVYDHFPAVCEKCAAPIDPKSCEETSAPVRYQTFELPEVKPIMDEHRFHELGCTCGHKTRAQLPVGVAQSQFGPRVHGAIGYLSSVHKIGRRGMMEILNNLFGLNLCLGKEVGHIFGCRHAFRDGVISRKQLLDATTLMRARMKQYCSKNPFHFLSTLMEAAFKGTPRPSLVH